MYHFSSYLHYRKREILPEYRGYINHTTREMYDNAYANENETHHLLVTQYDDEEAFNTLSTMFKANGSESEIAQYIIEHQTEAILIRQRGYKSRGSTIQGGVV